jgi:uncharacterized protein YdbL (DUF1318 family)
MHALKSMALIGLVALLAGCVPVTINITFPQEKIDTAASRIEDMVRAPQPTQPETPKRDGGKPSSSVSPWALVALITPNLADAQSQSVEVVPELKERTPEIMRAIESRRSRFPQVQALARQGCIGENNQGLLDARPGSGCDAGAVNALISAENRDREFLYETLRKQNNMPPGDIGRIRAGFAKANREKANPGEWIQQPNGTWVKK